MSQPHVQAAKLIGQRSADTAELVERTCSEWKSRFPAGSVSASTDSGIPHQRGGQRRACLCRRLLAIHLFLTTWLVMTPGLLGGNEPKPTKPAVAWSVLLDAVRDNSALVADRDRLIAEARRIAASPIVQRVYKYEDVGKFRTWLDGRALALEGSPRQSWFALAMSDYGTSRAIDNELPLLAAAYRLSGEKIFQTRILAQLEETATWSPLQRPGYTLGRPSDQAVAPDFNDGNWLATGMGVRALADTLEIMPADSLPTPLMEKLRVLLRREIASIADDWRTKRSWFIRSNVPRTNQWVLPTEGLIRSCLVLGKENHPDEYELGVRNLLAALDAQGSEGEFYEGIGYANFTVTSMLHAAHAMAVAGDTRGLDHPFLRRFPTWMAHHLQPGRFRINCFDAGGARTPTNDGSFRSLLSLFVVLTDDAVARWTLNSQFSGSSDDLIGLLARATTGESRDPGLFASYASAGRVNWRGNWANDATGVWVRGGHRLDFHDHFDRGHVNFIFRGKPILIEAGTPSYDNPRIQELYTSVIGHNVLEVPGSTVKKAPAPITVRHLDRTGGEVLVDATAGYAALTRWQREVTWNVDRLKVVDEVAFPPDKLQEGTFRWHLGTQDDVTIAESGTQFVVIWKDAEITLESSVPLVVASEMLPDNTVGLGEKVGPDFLHRCILVRTARPSNTWTLKTDVVGR